MFKKAIVLLTTISLCLSLSNVLNTVSAKEKRLKISASFYPIYFFTKAIVGTKGDVKSMIPNGVEPHDWEPKIKDIKYISECDLLIYNGLGLESWVGKVSASAPKELVLVNCSKGVKIIKNSKDMIKKEHCTTDPHIWNSPKSAKIEVLNIRNAIEKADPYNKAYYERNYKNLISKLNTLDIKYEKALRNKVHKNIVTSHAAFSYLARDYNFKQLSIENAYAEGEPSAKQMVNICDIVKEQKIKYVFSEELLSPKIADIIAEETHAKNLVLNPLESVKKGENYFSVMERNLKNLVKALN